MTYQIDGKKMLFTIDRIKIIDISVNDILEVNGFPGAHHIWTEHDSEFVENNPDDDLFLQIEKVGDNKYKSGGLILK